MRAKDKLRNLVISTNSYWPFSFLNRIPYYLAIKLFVLMCRRFPEIKGLYLRHGLTEENWVPGLSDIDLTVIIDSEIRPDEEYRFLRSFWRHYEFLKRILPLLGEVDILNDQYITSWTKFTIRGYEAKFWKLIYGTKTIKENYLENPERLSIDSINYALTIYTGKFLLKFYNNDNPVSLSSKELQRMAEKISRYARKFNTDRKKNHFDQITIKNKIDSLSFVINVLESNIDGLDKSGIERILENDEEKNGVVKTQSIDILNQIHVFELTKLVSEQEEIAGIIISDLENFIVLNDAIDHNRLKKCLLSIYKATSKYNYRFVIVGSSTFKYMMKYHTPYMYTHLKRKKTVFIEKNRLLDVRTPEEQFFIKSNLDQVINVLTFPQSHQLFSSIMGNWLKATTLETYLTRFQHLKLILEKGLTVVEHKRLLQEYERQYPNDYKKIALLEKQVNKNGSNSIKLFRLLRQMTHNVHCSLSNSTITESLYVTEDLGNSKKHLLLS